MTADHRSIHPNLPGLPWWAAIIVAVAATTAGFAIDAEAGTRELTHIFAALYVMGCVAAVLAVRQSGLFTAVIQPPLILFCAVPSAYWVFHGGAFNGIKGILINCGYPLIERFPLMLFTSAGVLLIGMGRWYWGMTARSATPNAATEATNAPSQWASTGKKLTAKLAEMFNPKPAHAIDATTSRRRRADDRPRRSTTPRRHADPAGRSGRSQPRHLRPPVDDPPDPRARRTQRRRPPTVRTEEPPIRRRPRPPGEPGWRGQPPLRDTGRDPYPRTARPTAASGWMDAHRAADPPEPRRYRPATKAADGASGSSATHHPISRVRYRRPNPGDEPPRQSRRPHSDDAESWQYDI